MIADCLTEQADSDERGFQWQTQNSQPNIGYKFLHPKDGFGYFFFKNKSSDTTLTASIDLRVFERL
jgi:hypothetical protein